MIKIRTSVFFVFLLMAISSYAMEQEQSARRCLSEWDLPLNDSEIVSTDALDVLSFIDELLAKKEIEPYPFYKRHEIIGNICIEMGKSSKDFKLDKSQSKSSLSRNDLLAKIKSMGKKCLFSVNDTPQPEASVKQSEKAPKPLELKSKSALSLLIESQDNFDFKKPTIDSKSCEKKEEEITEEPIEYVIGSIQIPASPHGNRFRINRKNKKNINPFIQELEVNDLSDACCDTNIQLEDN